MKKKKLIVQIPCLNEEFSLKETLDSLPGDIPGIDEIEIMIINDGSTDNTVSVARQWGVHHILDLQSHHGLARAFQLGIREAASLGADYLVNVDADNQYNADDISLLLKPLQEGKADMVVGERPIKKIDDFSPLKKNLQMMGSWIVRKLSGTQVMDTPSGFRALNRRAMESIYIFNPYTYTHESLIAARDINLRVCGVPIRVNKKHNFRSSKLMSNMWEYISKSSVAIIRFYLLYNPYKLLLTFSSILGISSLLLFIASIVSYIRSPGQDWIQVLILACFALIFSALSAALAILADIMRINRHLLQQILNEIQFKHDEKMQVK